MQPTPLDVRLQNLIKGWQGSQRGEGLTILYNQCVEIAGRESALLPARLYLTSNLDSVSLTRTLRQTSATVRFQTPTHGRFDSALVPTGKGTGPLDRFLLVIEASLPVRDQVALYAHAIGHLLLNYQNYSLERGLNLDPDSGMTHVDWLAELRYVETRSNRNKANREVLEAFPQLAELAEPPVESRATIEAATRELQQRLEALGWSKRNELLISPYEYTAGRVLTESARRGRKYSIDILLRASFSLPIAVVHAQRAGQTYEDGMHRVQDAATRLHVPFAYLVETNGAVHEFDHSRSEVPVSTDLLDLPTHAELVARWLGELSLTSSDERRILLQFYQQTKLPRYYQDAAINQALIAILRAKRGLRKPRILLTLATGTGKTRVAFQLLWKLKQSQAVRNVLFLADRSYLLDQAARNDFAPFGDAIWRGMGESKTSRDLLFASYQWLTTTQNGHYHFEDYPPDFFDIIIVDECHRGSADEDSQWHRVLQYFSPAVQIGLTATPLKSKDVQTHQYFGEAVYTYSLSRGINDGFLAPYRVRRILIGEHAQNAEPGSAASSEPPRQPELDPWRDVGTNTELAEKLVMETANTMRKYTQAIAEHLAHYLQTTDPRAKTIVFCVDNDHAKEMRDELQKACAGWIRPDSIVRIVNDDGADGKQALYEFCSTDTRRPVVVTTSKLLSTGIDAPTCKNIVLARGVGSMVEFKQIIGRGTRLFGTEKIWFTILDYAGAIKHFFDPEFDGNPEFITSELLNPQPTPEETAPEADTEGDNEDSLELTAENSIPEMDTPEGQNQEESQPVEPHTPAEVAAGASETYACDISSIPMSNSAVSEPAEESAGGALYPPDRPSDPPDEEQQNESVADPALTTAQTDNGSAPIGKSDTQQETGTPTSVPVTPSESELEAGEVVKERGDGTRVVVLDEILYELGPDIRLRSGTGQEWAKRALQDIVRTPEELRERWNDPLQREELLATLDDQAVPVEKLAAVLHMGEADPFDVLLKALFNPLPLTRAERVARLRQEYRAFFERFAANSLASQVLDAILNWYVTIPMAALSGADELDVSNIDLLELPSIARLGMTMELGEAFLNCGTHIETALEELQRLLYSV